MMPVGWTKSYQLDGGKKGRVFNTTAGASNDRIAEGTRRMMINAVYWSLDMEGKIPATGANADLVGEFKPTAYSFKGGNHWKDKNMRPADFK